jgi:hypothetical protein
MAWRSCSSKCSARFPEVRCRLGRGGVFAAEHLRGDRPLAVQPLPAGAVPSARDVVALPQGGNSRSCCAAEGLKAVHRNRIFLLLRIGRRRVIDPGGAPARATLPVAAQ